GGGGGVGPGEPPQQGEPVEAERHQARLVPGRQGEGGADVVLGAVQVARLLPHGRAPEVHVHACLPPHRVAERVVEPQRGVVVGGGGGRVAGQEVLVGTGGEQHHGLEGDARVADP